MEVRDITRRAHPVHDGHRRYLDRAHVDIHVSVAGGFGRVLSRGCHAMHYDNSSL